MHEAAGRYQSTVQYPGSDLAGNCIGPRKSLRADLGTRVLFASQDGYDTHSNQAGAHGSLLRQFGCSAGGVSTRSGSLHAADRVVTLVFSEFGRRVDENGSLGTDHGAASCMFLLGSKVKGGLAGTYPSLEKLGDGDLVFNTDFRSVYATVLDRWLARRASSCCQASSTA